MASPRIKTGSQGGALAGARILAFTLVIFIVGMAVGVIAYVAGLPFGMGAAMGGSVAGVVGFAMMAWGSLFETKVFTCPNCQHTDKTLREIGYYNCFNCGTQYRIHGRQVEPAIKEPDMRAISGGYYC